MKNQWIIVPIVLAIVVVASCFADSSTAAHRHRPDHHHGGAVHYSYAPRLYAPYPAISDYGHSRAIYGGYFHPHNHHHHRHGW